MFFFKNYEQELLQLPIKDTYIKEDLMTDSFLYAKHNTLEVFWAPFEYINKDAKVIILGITPGWTQMQLAFNYVEKISALMSTRACYAMLKSRLALAEKELERI